MKSFNQITEVIGKTPLVKINVENLPAEIYAKLEMFNPLSSVKDRAALYMINDAFERGVLKEGGTIVEPTSGNTGIGLAYIGKLRGCKVILTMPETMSIERRKLLQLLGASIELTPGSLGMKGAIEKAREIVKNTPGAFMPDQFKNKANAASHFETTAPEIWQALEGCFDIFIAGIGTGGTITGCGEFFKSKNANIKIIGVEPASSPVLNGGLPGPHKIQGIGAGFVPEVLNRAIIDGVLTVTDEEAYAGAAMLREQGLFCGISSGAALQGALKTARNPDNKGKRIVVLLPDTGERYLSLL